jgi:Leucine-rich repeat (LRR) protein
MKLTLTYFLFLLFSCNLFGQDNTSRPTYVYDGTISVDEGQSLKIRMNLLVLLDSTIVGSYYYRPSSGSLKLVGHLKDDNSFILTERNEKDSITGHFNGILAADKKMASGKWNSSEGNKHFDFNLTRSEITSYWAYINKNRKLHEYTDVQLAIKEADKVLSIDIARQDLNKLPKQLSKLKNIVSINLLGNSFSSFPTVLGSLTSLDEISLSSNQLRFVGKEIGRLSNLRILIMNFNQLTELPKEIGELTNLLYLEVGNNRLKQLPEEIKYLINLQELHVERNSLSETEKQKIKKLLPNCVIYF